MKQNAYVWSLDQLLAAHFYFELTTAFEPFPCNSALSAFVCVGLSYIQNDPVEQILSPNVVINDKIMKYPVNSHPSLGNCAIAPRENIRVGGANSLSILC